MPAAKIKFSAVGCLALAAGLWVVGCGKKTPVVTALPPVSAAAALAPASPDPMPSSPNPDASPALTTADGQPDLSALNHCLIRWIMGHRRKPASFEEFAATANVAIPQPPAGKKYVIAKNMHIQLVDR